MLETLTEESFRPHLTTSFFLTLGDPTAEPGSAESDAPPAIELRLVEVRATGTAAFKSGWAPPRLPFSAVFRGPSRPILPQRTYFLSHPAFGVLQLFLVPVASGAAGTDYEACFN